MCGRHQTRPVVRPLLWALLGALLTTGSAFAEDEPSREAEADVEVRGKKKTAKRAAHEAPESAFVVTVDETTPPSTTVADALEDVPGVSVRRLGSTLDPAFVRIRGSTPRQVTVYLDGMPLNALGSSAVDLSELALFAFDRVEVYRGFAPAHLGGFSIGGAINLVTDPTRHVPPGVSASTGSFTTRRLSGVGGLHGELPGGLHGQVRGFVGYVATEGDYDAFSHNGTLYNATDDAIVPRANNDAERFSGHVGLRARGDNFELSLWDFAGFFEGGVPGAYYTQTTGTRFTHAQNVLQGSATLRPVGGVTIDAGLGWHYRYESFEDLLGEIGNGRRHLRSDLHAVSGGVSAKLVPATWLEVAPSAQFTAAAYTPQDLQNATDGGTRSRFAPRFGVDARLLLWSDRVELRGSASLLAVFDEHEGEAAAPYVDGMPGFAAAFRPWDWLTVRGSVARGVRPPTFLELFGDRGTSRGNPDLLPESSVQVDGGARIDGRAHRFLAGSAEVAGFLLDTSNLIVFVPNSQRVAIPINLGQTRMAGVEAHVAGSFFEHLDLTVGLTAFGEATIVEGAIGHAGNRVPNVPLWQLDVDVAGYHGTYVRVGWHFSYTAGTFDSPSNFFEQAPRPIHGLTVRAQPGPLWPWIALELNNLADTRVALQYRNPHQPREDDRTLVALQDFRGQPLPGRSVMVTLGWTLDPPALRRSGATR